MVYHVLNRGVNRMRIFETAADYAVFEIAMEQVLEVCPMRICAYCLMPNHWHMVLWPEKDGDMARFMHRLCTTHATRWLHAKEKEGAGHVYQGRYKSFPVGDDEHFYTVMRYVERNALRAGLVERAEEWRWSSVWRREHGGVQQQRMLNEWPEETPTDWIRHVNEPLTEEELEAVRVSVRRGRPFGKPCWVEEVAGVFGLQSTLRDVRGGRPKKTGTGPVFLA